MLQIRKDISVGSLEKCFLNMKSQHYSHIEIECLGIPTEVILSEIIQKITKLKTNSSHSKQKSIPFRTKLY